MKSITIDGRKYKVVASFGWQGGHQTKVVATPDGDRKERVAIKRGGGWTFWTVARRGDRVVGLQARCRCKELEAENRRLRRALRFYAKYPEGDLGAMAKQALAPADAEKEA